MMMMMMMMMTCYQTAIVSWVIWR